MAYCKYRNVTHKLRYETHVVNYSPRNDIEPNIAGSGYRYVIQGYVRRLCDHVGLISCLLGLIRCDPLNLKSGSSDASRVA